MLALQTVRRRCNHHSLKSPVPVQRVAVLTMHVVVWWCGGGGGGGVQMFGLASPLAFGTIGAGMTVRLLHSCVGLRRSTDSDWWCGVAVWYVVWCSVVCK